MMGLPHGITFSGELFRGSNLGCYYGGILNTSRVNGLATAGGWASLGVKLHSKLLLTTGFGLDDPQDRDLAKGDRSYNQILFGNLKYTIVQSMTAGIEVSHWQTSYVLAEAAHAVRVETSVALSF